MDGGEGMDAGEVKGALATFYVALRLHSPRRIQIILLVYILKGLGLASSSIAVSKVVCTRVGSKHDYVPHSLHTLVMAPG